MTGRRYSGYDEYEGIFGPLGVHGSAGRHARGANGAGFPSFSRKSSRRRTPADVLARHASRFANTHSSVETRARYLAERHAKRRLESFERPDDDADADDSEHEGDGAVTPLTGAGTGAGAGHTPLLPSHQRQVWLPTREFAFRQRAGKLDMRAIARVDLARVVATTDVDTIQRHVENLAFADVTLEDVQHYSDAYFLKLFQIAQAQSLVAHSDGVETQCEQLLAECQQLERDNSGLAADVAALKTEIRHKQRTLATFEVMLLNASVAQRRTGPRGTTAAAATADKENAAAEANAVVDALLGTGADDKEDGVVTEPPVDCVVCGKKFLSPAYLVRHQQRKHQSDKRSVARSHRRRTSQSSSGSYSRSDSDSPSSKRQHAVRPPKTAPLPPEVVRALEEKSALAAQLAQLQEQLRLEKAARDAQTALLEQQQSQLATQVVGNMGKLQDLLLDMERKQETAKQDVMQYTQATLVRLQHDAASTRALKRASETAAATRVGAIESDDEGGGAAASKSDKTPRSEGAAPLEQVLEVFLRAQAQQQQQIDALAHENRQLVSQRQRKPRRRRPRDGENDDSAPSLSALLQMAALDAQRFGVDHGDAVAVSETAPVRSAERAAAVCEDKLVQTDEDADTKTRAVPARAVVIHEVQTDPVVLELQPAVAAPVSKVVKPTAVVAPLELGLSPPQAVKKQTTPSTTPSKTPSPPEAKPESRPSRDKVLQHAAQVVGKVARGFLTRRKLQNLANWLVCLPFAALEATLSDHELQQLRQLRSGGGTATRDLVVEVHIGMTANELRLEVARGLAGASVLGTVSNNASDDEAETPIDYHRVLLHHTVTREELVGDRPIHALRNQIDVEIVPFYGAAEAHIESVFAVHSDATERLHAIRRASEALAGDSNGSVSPLALRRLVRLQAHVRGFLAKRAVAMLRIDRLVDQRLLHMREAVAASRRRTASSDRARASSADSALADPLIVQQCQKVRERLAVAVQSRLGVDSQHSSSTMATVSVTLDRVSSEALAQQLLVLEHARSQLAPSVQTRIQSLQMRLEHLVQTEYDPQQARTRERQRDAARTIQNAVHVAIARRRLQMLLGSERERRTQAATTGSAITAAAVPVGATRDTGEAKDSDGSARHSPASSLSLSRSRISLGESSAGTKAFGDTLEDFDAAEIERLANAYEDGGELQRSVAAAAAAAEAIEELPLARSRIEHEHKHEGRADAQVPASGSQRPATPALEELTLADEKPRASVAAVVRRAGAPLRTTAVPRAAEQQARASTPIRHAAETFEPGQSPRPTQGKEIISPFSKTPLLSRRSGAATQRGSGYDNAR